MTVGVILRSMATKDLIACGKGAVNGKACRAAEFRVGGAKHGTCYKKVFKRGALTDAVKGGIGLDAVSHVGLVSLEGRIVPLIAVL